MVRHKLLKIASMIAICGIAVVLFAWTACGCAPLEYRELAVEEVPREISLDVARTNPGFKVIRAWSYGHGLNSVGGRIQGYLLRGPSLGGWSHRDIKFPARDIPRAYDPIELRPIE